MSQPERVAEALRVIQRTADKQGNVTMLRLAENLANDAALVRLAQSEALRTAARTFVTEMGDTWGGDSQWLTTGTRVAEVVACVLREMAADLENECGLTGSPAPHCPTCIHPEGYDRLSGPCPTCDGDVVSSSGTQGGGDRG